MSPLAASESRPPVSAHVDDSACDGCAHCGLPVGTLGVRDGDLAFCCGGCCAVYHAITSSGLGAYYEKRTGNGQPAQVSTEGYAHFDDPEFLRRHSQVLHASGMPSPREHTEAKSTETELRRAELYIEGLHCSACVWLIEKLPNLVPGVLEARLSYSDSRVEVTWNPERTRLSAIAKQLDALGYPPHLSSVNPRREIQLRNQRSLLIRMGVAGAVFGNVMLLSFALYSGEGDEMSPQFTQFFRWASFLFTVPSVLFTGRPFFQGAIAAFRTRTPHMDLPISIGIVAGLLLGSVNTLRGAGEVYFDSVAMLVFLLLLGRWLHNKQLNKAQQATDLLLALAPSTSRVQRGEQVVQVPTECVEAGDVVELLSGDRIGIDGIVLEGNSSIDESLLSGEASPVRTSVGKSVFAGTINLESRLLVKASKPGTETRLSQLVRDIERAARFKSPMVLLADRISGYFVPVVLTLGLLTLLLWWPAGSEVAVERAMALLIVTCPCALGLATPLAGSLAVGQAARNGILIQGARFLEAMNRPGLFVFDKTGTLTQGKWELLDWRGSRATEALVRAAEESSAHPIARAFVRNFTAATARTSQVTETLGRGIIATVTGARVVVGSRDFVLDQLDLPASTDIAALPVDGTTLARRDQELIERGLTPVYIAVDGALETVAGFGDPLRPEAAACLSRLRAAGHRLALLSGDRTAVVERVTAMLGVSFETALGEQSPEQKLAFVQDSAKQGPVYMVGDGVNDAGALSAATVGIAVAGGAEASLMAADIFSTRTGLSPLLELIEGSRRTLRVIRVNLALSLLYNALAATLAVLGWITPLAAAILMPLSSLTVVANTLRTRCFDPLGSRTQAIPATEARVFSQAQRTNATQVPLSPARAQS